MRLTLPEVQIELVATNAVSNLLRREADIAVRMVQPEQATVITRRVGKMALKACAHQDYLRRRGHGMLPEAALARRKASDPRLAERFELYACGVELANAFGELTDAEEQRRRFETDLAEKERIYGERYPIDDAFLEALRTMPQAAGAALATVVGVLIEVPVMLSVVWIVNRSKPCYERTAT